MRKIRFHGQNNVFKGVWKTWRSQKFAVNMVTSVLVLLLVITPLMSSHAVNTLIKSYAADQGFTVDTYSAPGDVHVMGVQGQTTSAFTITSTTMTNYRVSFTPDPTADGQAVKITAYPGGENAHPIAPNAKVGIGFTVDPSVAVGEYTGTYTVTNTDNNLQYSFKLIIDVESSAFGMSLNPTQISLGFKDGISRNVGILTPYTATKFVLGFTNSPAVFGTGITWESSSNGVFNGSDKSSIALHIGPDVPVGTYQGSATITNPDTNAQVTIPLTVKVFNPVYYENNFNQGTQDYELTEASRFDYTQHRYIGIEGYAAKVSVVPGGTIGFSVSSINNTPFKAEVYRLGYYSGKGSKLVKTIDPIQGHFYPMPVANPSSPTDPAYTGELNANWPASFFLTIPQDWVSGVYLVKLTTQLVNNQHYQGNITFVVKEPNRNSDLVLIHHSNTDEAYNEWGAKSVYQDDSYTNGGQEAFQNRAYKVSFNRPSNENWGAGQIMYAEYAMIRFLENMGYDVTYLTDYDIDQNPGLLLHHKGIVIGGHSEYWSYNAKNGIANAIAHGVNFANFGGNNIYWQIRYEDNGRTLVCYKYSNGGQPGKPTDTKDPDAQDPTNMKYTTVRWRDYPLNNAEQNVLGAMYNIYDGLLNQQDTFPLIVTDASNWVFAGTGLINGDQVPGIVGHEIDEVSADNDAYSPQKPANTDVVSDSPVQSRYKDSSGNYITIHSKATIYQAPSGAYVFDGASVFWPLALDPYVNEGSRVVTRHPNGYAQRITKNILDKFSSPATVASTSTIDLTNGGAAIPTIQSSTTTIDQPIKESD